MDSATPFYALQAVGSQTFCIPPEYLAGKLSLPQLWDFHLDNSPNHPLFVFERSLGHIEKVSWSQGVKAMHRAGRIIQPCISRSSATKGADPPVVAVFLTFKDILASWAVITAIMRVGATPFIISPRNSAAASAHLLQQSNCCMILSSTNAAIHDLAHTALNLMNVDYELSVINMPSYSELFLNEDSPFERLPPCEVFDMDGPALIIHSSGSTAFPKLVVTSHRTMFHWSLIPYFGDKDLCGSICGSQSLPLFHTMGVTKHIIVPSSSGQIGVVYGPFDDPIPPTAETVLSTAVACGANYIYTVPTFIEEWAAEDKIEQLRSFEVIIFAGGPLKTHIGDRLAAQGVRLCCQYGTSEVGAASRMVFDGRFEDWEYIRVTRETDIHWEPYPGQEHLFEAVVLESPYKSIPEANTTISGRRAFATRDLFEKHPTIEGLWRVYGRGDFQITHSTGEKTNPVPIEGIITQHPLVSHAVMFGRAQFHAGVLVECSPATNVDPTDPQGVRAFIERIWPTIHEANESAPKHSRITKQMVVVASPKKPFLLTAKHTLRRSAILTDYADEIEAAYRNMRYSGLASVDVAPPSSWELVNARAFVRSVIGTVLSRGKSVGDEDDLFQSGADSLQAMAIRSAIASAFRATGLDPTLLKGNFVYTNPTITSLARFVTNCANSGEGNSVNTADLRVREMEAALADFTEPFIVHTPDSKRRHIPDHDHETVLVTGTTGSVGSHLLAHLVAMPSVVCVYALNRSGGDEGGVENMKHRQTMALERQGIDGKVGHSTKIIYLEGDVTLPGFNLDASMRSDILSSLTTIIHNAWTVNFNLTFSSFRPLLQGVRNIVEFALLSPCVHPPRIVFVSSVSVLSGWKQSSHAPECILDDPHIAGKSGYAMSKWVAEHMLDVARKTTALKPVVIRVGQLCGSSSSGSWNANEWFPLIVRSANGLNCLPACTGSISWLPVNVAASVIIELRHAPEWMECVHVMHPKPVSWMSIMEPLAKTLQVPIIPYSAWLQKLFDASADLPLSKTVPAIFLIDLFASMKQEAKSKSEDALTDEAFGEHVFAMKHAFQASAIMEDPALPTLTAADVARWVQFWKENGKLDV